ncbi:DNA-binding protein [Nitrosospira multiformis]|uniref:DNA-binding protein n=1 Tax=Nitrosospira multiformis TaxID=1231 RepID=UPI0015E64413|nr:DNA-binding protein [Nitrosospira multiformis]
MFWAVQSTVSTSMIGQRVAEALSLPLQELATTAGVHRNTIRSHPESPKLQHYLREMLRVMSAASASQSDFNRVLFWFKNVPISSFNHKTALQLIAEGRTDDIVAYLESIQSGYVG